MNNFIVKRIKEARIERGLTQKDLAKHLDRTAASVSDLERGKVQVTASDLYKLAKYLNKPIEYFFGESYGGKEIDDLVSIIRKMDPEVRSNQITIINSLLSMQMSFDNLEADGEVSDEALKEKAQETYDHLIRYLVSVRQMYEKGLEAKAQMEEILEIGDNELSNF
jgi:transcriptional regulator with XRE-family HTH domain